MSLRASPWWPAFVAALRDQPLDRLAGQLGLSPEALADALREADTRGRAEDAAWWPEALRERAAGASVRAVAQRWESEPRRVRRALARQGLRAGGQDLDGKGVPVLVAFRAELGTRPDAEIARAAHLIPEAVKGERARLGLAPFRPRSAPELTAEDEAWILGPVREKKPRVRPDPDAATVVHRARTMPPPEDRPPSPRSRGPVSMPQVEVRGRSIPAPDVRGRSIPAPDVRGRSLPAPDLRPPSVPPPDARPRSNPPPESRHASESRPRSLAPGELPRWGPDRPDRPDRQEELERLLQPGSRSREGRMRLVRKEEAPRSVAPEERAPTLPDVPRAVRRVGANVSMPTAPALPTPPAPPAPTQHEWFVWVPGEETPLVVHAPDIARAIDAASVRLPWEVLQKAQFARADRKPG